MKYQNFNHEQQPNLCRKDFQFEFNGSFFIQLSCQELRNSTKINAQQTVDSQEFSEIDQNSSGCVQLLVEGFEMSDLLDKFDNISKNNISKNIIKSFFSYLLDKKSNDLLVDFVQKGILLPEARKMVKNYYKSYNFNNNIYSKIGCLSQRKLSFFFTPSLEPQFKYLDEEEMNQSIFASSTQGIKIQKIAQNQLNEKQHLKQALISNQSQYILQESYLEFYNDQPTSSENKKTEFQQTSFQNDQSANLKNSSETDFFLNDCERQEEDNGLILKLDTIDKNNISKNIIKAFFKYLLDNKNDLLIDFALRGAQPAHARKQAKNFINSYNYNNSSLHKLIQHPKYGKAFEFYLTFEAEKWLSDSKVKQKEDHHVFINYLKLCCCDPDYANLLVAYKKIKKSCYNDRL
ncbi:hypothetical protein ABPG74_015462 [Tetrahymena malaccensis]